MRVFEQFNLLARAAPLKAGPSLSFTRPGFRSELPRRFCHVVIATHLRHKPNEMSGGQQQRVAMARALVDDPSILLADKFTGDLNSESQEEIMAPSGRS